MADVHVAIRIGRTIMQNELFARARIPQLAVNVLISPRLQNAGLLLGRPAFMGKSVFGRKTVGR
jgi:hypothetical protein